MDSIRSYVKSVVLPLAAVIFFTVSGGPYGIEPLIGYAGNFDTPADDHAPALGYSLHPGGAGTEQHDAGGRRLL